MPILLQIDKGGPSKCTYPAHAVPVCKKGDPCYFDCKDGYTPSPASKPTQCVCKSPNKECNGKCGKYAACPSGKPKRELLPRDSACARGLTACGVLGGRRNAFECVDTVSDLESCTSTFFALLFFLLAKLAIDMSSSQVVVASSLWRTPLNHQVSTAPLSLASPMSLASTLDVSSTAAAQGTDWLMIGRLASTTRTGILFCSRLSTVWNTFLCTRDTPYVVSLFWTRLRLS